MQPNDITLDVNDDNDDGTTPAVEVDYSRYSEFANRTVYISEHHTVAARDLLGLYRTEPKQSGNFNGVAKSAFKFTKDFAVDGVDSTTSLVAPGIVEVGFSFPVGLTPAQTLELRMRAAALIVDDTVMVPLCDQLMV